MVRPKLEYATTVWTPHNRCYIDSLEAVQRRYLKFLYYKKFGVYPERNVPQEVLLQEFLLESLEKRRISKDIQFVTSVANGRMDCAPILQRLNFRVPRLHCKIRDTFYVAGSKRDCYKFAPVNRMCNEINNLSDEIDIFCNTNLR